MTKMGKIEFSERKVYNDKEKLFCEGHVALDPYYLRQFRNDSSLGAFEETGD